MLLMATDSSGNVFSRELDGFGKLNMSIVSDEDNFRLKINDKYELYEEFSTEEDAIEKMALITNAAKDYFD